MFEVGDEVWFIDDVMSTDFKLRYDGESYVRKYYRDGMPEGFPTITEFWSNYILIHLPNHSNNFIVKRNEIRKAMNSIEKIKEE